MLRYMQHVAASKNTAAWNMQYYPVVQEAKEVLVNLAGNSFSADFSADIDKCYDMIPHADLLEALRHIRTLCCSHYRRMHRGKQPSLWLRLASDASGCMIVQECLLTHRTLRGWTQLAVDDWLQANELLLLNCIVQVNGQLHRQSSGIPHGVNCGPDWANLFLLSQEVKFLDAHMESRDKADLVHNQFYHWYRLIDDVRLLNHPDAASALRAVYPSYLSMSATCKDPDEEELFGAETGFLDIQSHLCWSGKLVTSIIRKEQKLPFQVVQYVHLESNRPVRACYNVLINLVLAVVWHCNTSGDFLA